MYGLKTLKYPTLVEKSGDLTDFLFLNLSGVFLICLSATLYTNKDKAIIKPKASIRFGDLKNTLSAKNIGSFRKAKHRYTDCCLFLYVYSIVSKACQGT